MRSSPSGVCSVDDLSTARPSSRQITAELTLEGPRFCAYLDQQRSAAQMPPR